jgi:hypothetical protein
MLESAGRKAERTVVAKREGATVDCDRYFRLAAG